MRLTNETIEKNENAMVASIADFPPPRFSMSVVFLHLSAKSQKQANHKKAVSPVMRKKHETRVS